MLIHGILASHTPLTNIVGSRIYAVLLPKVPTTPAVTYFEITATIDAALDSTAVTEYHVQVDGWASTYLTAKSIQATLHSLLDAYQGTLPDGTSVKSVSSTNNPDFYEPDTQLYRSSTTFSFLTTQGT